MSRRNADLYCLSVRQPHASLIIGGWKDVENRTWATKHRGPLLIHASLHLDSRADTRGVFSAAEVRALPRGGIIGVVTVIDCDTTSDSPWFTGPIGWELIDPRALDFQPCAGRLGLFKIAPEKAAAIAVRAYHRLPLFGG